VWPPELPAGSAMPMETLWFGMKKVPAAKAQKLVKAMRKPYPDLIDR
jgi:hypothetical protein